MDFRRRRSQHRCSRRVYSQSLTTAERVLHFYFFAGTKYNCRSHSNDPTLQTTHNGGSDDGGGAHKQTHDAAPHDK